MKLNYSIILLLIMISNPAWRAQGGSEVGIPEADKSALEGIIVEKYYVSDTTDQKDSLGGFLEAGSTT